MNRALFPALTIAFFLSPFSAALAQENVTHIGYAYPAGGRQGTTFEVKLGGQYLNEIRRVYFSGAGVEARVLDKIKSLTEPQVRELRQKLTELNKDLKVAEIRKQKDVEIHRQIAQINRTLARRESAQLRRQTQPAISETVSLEVTIRADAEPGQREMRVETSRGVSNPLRFYVGVLPEFREQEPGLDLEPQNYNTPVRFPHTVTTDITLPAVVNGQIVPREPDVVRYDAARFTPGDADRYRFQARKGQRLVIAAAARDLIPYLADAVPGWFQATLTLYDAKGKQLAYDDDYRFHPDPVLFFKVPEDGQYTIEIKDAIYRGRPDFVYRITIGEIPFVTGIFPLGGRAGEQTSVDLAGWNLPGDKFPVDAMDKVPGIYPLAPRKGEILCNAVPFAVDSLPECREKEPNDTPATAQAVTLPVIVNGRIDRPGDWDVYRFQGKAGQAILAEVLARRLDSPLDSVLELTDSAGKRLAFNDDHEDKADAINTHYADSLISFTLPANGVYFLRLGDAQHKGGPEYAYRLRISAPRPDFELRVVPSCINSVSWRLTPITVFALRRDGFSGDIALRFKDAPPGLSMSGALVPAGQDRVRVTLAVPPWMPSEPVSLCLEGTASIAGAEVVHKATGADDMMQAFAYRHLVPAQDLTLVLQGARSRGPVKIPPVGRRYFEGAMTLLGQQPVKIPAGGTADMQVRTGAAGSRGEIQVELSDPPEGIVVDRVSRMDRGIVVVLRGDAAKAKPGLKGNLIAIAYQKRTETNKEGKTREVRSLLGTLPAIPFEIVKP